MNLEAASLDDVVSSAATWERVLRKLARASDAAAERAASAGRASTSRSRRGSRTRSIVRGPAAATPGRFVVHRLNRTEYGNAIRDLLALDVDVSQLLPSDGAEFGFDNIATALKTSPLLLERYLTAAQRVSTLRGRRYDGAARDDRIFDQS